MRLRLITGVIALGLATGSARAVVGGTPDTSHVYVGAALQHQVHDGISGNERCSGLLVSATKFVTAAHCFDPSGDPIRITFALDSRDPAASFVQVPASAVVASPGFDVAVVTLGDPQPGPYATLPGGAVALNSNDRLVVVGYGVSAIQAGKVADFGVRRSASTKLAGAGNLDPVYVKTLADPGSCLGDSGGPDLDADGVAVAMTVFSNGNPNCNGVAYSLRLDNPDVRAFIAQS